MIRVYFEEREPADVPANRCAVGAAGELILDIAEIVEETDPRDLRVKRIGVQTREWLRTYSAASGWLYAEPVASESTVGSVAEPEEAIR